ncbi:hypothetical protein Bca101_022833 [Brassica carinata]
MDPTDTHSQEPEGDFINTQCSNPAGDENVDHLSADELTNQTDVSLPQVTENSKETKCGTDTTEETSSDDDGSEIGNDAGKNGEDEHLEKDNKGSWSNVEDKKGPENVLKEIQMQKTHGLYCPNCTHNITGTAKFLEKGQEAFPYNKERFPVKTNQILPPEVPSDPKPDNMAILLEKIREKLLPNRLPRLTPTSQRFLLFLVLLLLSVILLLTLPSRPSPPPGPAKHGSSTKTNVQPRPGENIQESEDRGDNGGGVSFTWHTNFLNTNPPVIEIIPEKKPNNNESQEEDSPNEEGHTSKVLSIKLDILKSIVYGGLIESITSFGVVSSAAASGTSTLNVLALGLANLFSGLFIIVHNLYGLFKRPRYQSWNNDHMPELVSEDPYEELLGKRNRVILHCFVVLVSFILFGVIPPLFYGFSFKIADKGHYQEAAIVVAASLICVISLSFAKAYAFGMDKLKTVAVYTGIAIGGSALSFVASQHARDVFSKYDVHKLASDYFKG